MDDWTGRPVFTARRKKIKCRKHFPQGYRGVAGLNGLSSLNEDDNDEDAERSAVLVQDQVPRKNDNPAFLGGSAQGSRMSRERDCPLPHTTHSPASRIGSGVAIEPGKAGRDRPPVRRQSWKGSSTSSSLNVQCGAGKMFRPSSVADH